MTAPSRARKTATAFALGTFFVLVLGACGDSTEPNPVPPTSQVTVQLDHAVGADPLELNVIRYTNAAGNHYRIQDLRYYVSNLVLLRADGSQFTTTLVHYRDASVASTRDWTIPDVPNGDYTGVRFLFGLDVARNHTDGLPTTPENLLMQWPTTFGGGYHYMQLDGGYEHGSTIDGWLAHLGRLQRATDPVPLEHHFTVELPAAIHVAGGSTSLRIVMDVNAWFASPNLYDFNVVGGSVMDNPPVQNALMENGAHVFSIGQAPLAAR